MQGEDLDTYIAMFDHLRDITQCVTVLASYCALLPMFTLTMSYLLRSRSASLSGM